MTLAVRSAHTAEIPLTDQKGRILVSDEYLAFLVEKLNAKMECNVRHNTKLSQAFQKFLASQ